MQPQYAYQSAPMNMPMLANGGLASAAQSIQAKGRGDDTMLVHMTPREVKGLQALAMAHGGSLTINPETGLPEAGFLDNLLPTIIGAGLTFFSGGTLNPMTIGMMTGGFEALRTGDLGRGIMAGLGAYGGAGLGNALVSSGAQQMGLAEGAKALGTDVASISTPEGMAQALGPVTPGGGYANADAFANAFMKGSSSVPQTFAGQLGAAQQGISSLGQQGGMTAFAQNLGSQFPSTTEKVAAATPTLIAASTPPPMAMSEPVDEGFNYEGPYEPSERTVRYPTDRDTTDSSEFMYFSPSNPVPGYQPMYAAQGGLMALKRYAEGGETDPPSSNQSPMTNLNNRMMRRPDENYVPGMNPEFDYNFKPVEVEGRTPVGAPPASPGGKGPLAQLLNQVDIRRADSSDYADLEGYVFDPQTQRLVKASRAGGLQALREGGFQMADGSFVMSAREVAEVGNGSSNAGLERLSKMGAQPIRGKGDGVSDSIKANIGGSQEARVARDEAYFPPEAVKKIGGGSPKKGAKKLYALMSAAEKARKKATRGEDSGLHRLMPA